MGKPTGPDELILSHKNGRQIIVEIRAFPINIKGQELVLGIARNITERKQVEEALRESEERFRYLSESSPLGVFQTDKDGRVLQSHASDGKPFVVEVQDGSVFISLEDTQR